MSQYSKFSHLRELAIRKLVGPACVAEIAIYSGKIWSTTGLEDFLYPDRGEHSGQLRKMLNGILPEDITCKSIQSKLKRQRLLDIKNHDYWKMLSKNFRHSLLFRTLFEKFKDAFITRSSVPNEIFFEGYNYDLREAQFLNDLIATENDLSSFDLFLEHTAKARIAIVLNKYQFRYRYGLTTRYLFPRVVPFIPHLYIRWPLLAQYYKNKIWCKPDGIGDEHWNVDEWQFFYKEMEIGERIARDANNDLPPKHFFRRINKSL